LITIHPLKRTFIHKGVETPLFSANSYIFTVVNNWHEKKLKHTLKQLLHGKQGSVIDAGAFLGDTSIPIAKDNPGLIVYAIEPSINNHEYIQTLKSLNHVDNLIAVNALLSDTIKYFDTEQRDQANASYHETSNHANAIQSNTVDNMVRSGMIKTPVVLLHFDVEGMELAVLKGSEQTIKRFKPIIVVEMLGRNSDNLKIVHYLNGLGYGATTIDESCAFGDIFDRVKCRNVLFLHTPAPFQKNADSHGPPRGGV
jgi:FkbM family methyltransferase